MTINTQKLRDLIAKATPGPWTWKQIGTYSTPGCALFWPDGSKGGVHYRRLDSSGGMTEADAELITNAVRVLPALLNALDDYRDTGASAVRWAPSSAHWSGELRRLFGDDAREGIDVAERRLRDAQSEVESKGAEIARLRGLVSEMADNDTYETEYDGRMYSICHGCGAQDGEDHRRPDCLYVRASAALSGEGE